MPVTYHDELIDKRQQIQDAVDAFLSDEDFDPDAVELRELRERGEKVDRQLKAVEEAEAARAAQTDMIRRVGRAPASAAASDDIGAQLIQSRQFQNWKRSGASGRAKLMDVALNTRALITTSTVDTPSDRVYATQANAPTPLLGVLNRIQVSSGSVDVVTYGTPPAAGAVAEGTQKPEANLAITVTPTTLDTLAHWVEATRQIVEDEPRLRDFINNSLLRGVYRKQEADAVTALTGGTFTAASGGNMMEAIRVGMAIVQTQGFSPNAVIMNALDAASLDYWAWDNSGGANSSIWGLRVVASGDVPAGSAFVGDFISGVHHYYRAAAELFVTDSDVGTVAGAAVSNFRRNVLTFLAEVRSKSVVVQPAAIAEATPTAGGATTGVQPQQQPAQSQQRPDERKKIDRA